MGVGQRNSGDLWRDDKSGHTVKFAGNFVCNREEIAKFSRQIQISVLFSDSAV